RRFEQQQHAITEQLHDPPAAASDDRVRQLAEPNRRPGAVFVAAVDREARVAADVHEADGRRMLLPLWDEPTLLESALDPPDVEVVHRPLEMPLQQPGEQLRAERREDRGGLEEAGDDLLEGRIARLDRLADRLREQRDPALCRAPGRVAEDPRGAEHVLLVDGRPALDERAEQRLFRAPGWRVGYGRAEAHRAEDRADELAASAELGDELAVRPARARARVRVEEGCRAQVDRMLAERGLHLLEREAFRLERGDDPRPDDVATVKPAIGGGRDRADLDEARDALVGGLGLAGEVRGGESRRAG